MYLKHILSLLRNVKKSHGNQFTSLCPAHDDHLSSLSIRYDVDTRKTLLHCHANCTISEILSALNLTSQDLFEKELVTDEYEYHDELGNLLYTKKRFNTKRFTSVKKDRRTLYNLTGIVNKQKIYYVEGEKDVDNLTKLGFAATTAGGANDWLPAFSKWFIGKEVILLGDNDEAGRRLIDKVKNDIQKIAGSVSICWSPYGKDISDYINKLKNDGKNDEEIYKAIRNIDKELDFEVSGKGRVLHSVNNVKKILSMIGWDIYYDIIKKEVYKKSVDGLSRFTDGDAFKVLNEFTSRNIDIKKIYINDCLDFIASNNKHNPVEAYLKEQSEKYTFNRDYIKDLYDCITIRNEHELSYTMFKRWFVQAVKVGCNNNGKYKGENVLVLQGDQGIKKTTFINKICPDSKWIKDGVSLNPEDKDSVYKACGHWLIELGEFDSTMKSCQAKLKQFLSETNDKLRLPYDRRHIEIPRTTCFTATVNKDAFLKDETGSRRYWVIECEALDINKQIGLDINRIWGYAYYLWKNNLEISYITQDEYEEVLSKNNSKYNVIENPILEFINEYYDGDVNDKLTSDVYSDYVMETGSDIKKQTFCKQVCKLFNLTSKVAKLNGKCFKKFAK